MCLAQDGAEYVKIVEEYLAELPHQINGIFIVCANPKGFNSGVGKKAERGNYVPVNALPQRLSNVMPLDYTFHNTVNVGSREQTKIWAPPNLRRGDEGSVQSPSFNSLCIACGRRDQKTVRRYGKATPEHVCRQWHGPVHQ